MIIEACEPRVLLTSYVVATNGSDSAVGSLAAPFATIQHAANVAQPGDTIYIRGGTYHETVTPPSGTASAPIIFEPYNGELVTVSGADPLSGWTNAQGSVYYAPMSWNLGDGNNQLFVDGIGLNEARWPNNSGPDLYHATTATISSSTTTANPSGPYLTTQTATIQSPSLTAPAGAWVGATIHIAPGQQWIWQTGTVLSNDVGALTYQFTQLETSYQLPSKGNPFYLTGKYQALDAPGEWYLDSSTGLMYLWTPQNDNPGSHDIEVKHRQFAFDLSNDAFIDVRGINIFAATINTNAASHDLLLANLNASYISQQINNLSPFNDKYLAPSTGILINGNNITLRDSSINYSSGNGVAVTGDNNTIENNFISNTDSTGYDEAGILVLGSSTSTTTTGNVIANNSVSNTGRNGILDYYAGQNQILRNIVHDTTLMTTDGAGIYSWETNGMGTEIGYNTTYNIRGGGFGNDGIFLDNTDSNFIVDHNVVWNCDTALKVNGPTAANMQIYNNTLVGVQYAFFGHPMDMPGSVLENNIFDGVIATDPKSTVQNNLKSTSPGFVDAADHNYQLAAGSPAIDAGLVIAPYTDGYSGSAPDEGAFEFDQTPITAGATFVTPPIYVPSGDTGGSSGGGTSGGGTSGGGTTGGGTSGGGTSGGGTSGGGASGGTSGGTTGTTPTPVFATSQIAASSYASMLNVQTAADSGVIAAKGSWMKFSQIDFGTTGVKALKLRLEALASKLNLKVQFRADSLTGPIVATVVPIGGRKGTAVHVQQATTRRLKGTHDLYLVVTGKTATIDLESFSFVAIPSPKKKAVAHKASQARSVV
jgi:hypothetical protein